MNLLLFEESELRADRTALIVGRRLVHLVKVLGATPGSELRAGVKRGPRGVAVVEAMSDAGALVRFRPIEDEARVPTVSLVLAIPRPKALSRCLRHAAAFGVLEVSLINAWRVEKSYLGSPRLQPPALEEDVLLGCEQGGHTWVPTVRVYPRFMEYCSAVEPVSTAARVVAHPGQHDTMASCRGVRECATVTIAIGPDGGWIERELATLGEIGFRGISLSSSVLRTEAAVVAALAQLELVRGASTPGAPRRRLKPPP